MDKSSTSSSKNGFTLAEILLAMMVFAIAITTILGLLARSIETADSILMKDEAINLSSAVESYMSELPFSDAYTLVRQFRSFYAYNYRAKPDQTRSDGTLSPHPIIAVGDQLGVEYLVVPGVRVRATNDPFLNADNGAREGRLFEVKLRVSSANPGSLPSNLNSYDQAVLVVYAEFYNVPTLGFNASALDPVFSYTFAVRR